MLKLEDKTNNYGCEFYYYGDGVYNVLIIKHEEKIIKVNITHIKDEFIPCIKIIEAEESTRENIIVKDFIINHIDSIKSGDSNKVIEGYQRAMEVIEDLKKILNI